MERAGERTRDIRFWSAKSNCMVCVHTHWARDYAKQLEQEPWVQHYEVNVPLEVSQFAHVARVDIRSSYFSDEWTTDFLLFLQDGRKEVRELVQRELLTKRANLEQLELSRRYWSAMDVIWKVVIMGDAEKL